MTALNFCEIGNKLLIMEVFMENEKKRFRVVFEVPTAEFEYEKMTKEEVIADVDYLLSQANIPWIRGSEITVKVKEIEEAKHE